MVSFFLSSLIRYFLPGPTAKSKVQWWTRCSCETLIPQAAIKSKTTIFSRKVRSMSQDYQSWWHLKGFHRLSMYAKSDFIVCMVQKVWPRLKSFPQSQRQPKTRCPQIPWQGIKICISLDVFVKQGCPEQSVFLNDWSLVWLSDLSIIEKGFNEYYI